MNIKKIPISDTRIQTMARNRGRATVEGLAASMDKVGLLNPITVIPSTYAARGKADNPGFLVLAGGHRFEAAQMLGWNEIDAIVLDVAGDDYTRHRMIEITENLHRAELTALERGKLVEEWRELTMDKVTQVASPLPGGDQPLESGIRKTANELGATQREVQRSLRIASLSPEAQEAAVELKLDDNQSALLDAAKHTDPAKQVQALYARRKPTFIAEPPKDDFEVTQRQVAALNLAWEKARPEARKIFLEGIGER